MASTNVVTSAGGTPSSASYVTNVAESGLSNEQALAALSTGLMKVTTTTGAITTAVAGTDYVAPNGAITGATKTKVTYDAKGLVTAGADATTADIADSLNRRYVTDAQLVVIGNTSGTNTGDQTNISGNAATVTVADAVEDTTTWVLLGTSQTGSLAPATDAGLTYNASTGVLTSTGFSGPLTGNVTGTASGNANTALSNLASVAINTALLPDAAAADDFGSATLPFKDLFLAGSSGTPGTNNFRLTGASTSGTRVITFPNATDTLVGKDTTDTLTNKTLTAPKIANAGFIADANGNELIIFTTTASAVNEVTYANGSTGVNPKFTASGETNVGLDFQSKGTGVYRLLGTADVPAELRLYEDTTDGTNYTAFKVGTQTGDVTYTLPTADGAASTFLQTNGSGVLSWAAPSGGGTPLATFATVFEASTRNTNAVTGTGTITYGTSGLNTSVTAGAGSAFYEAANVQGFDENGFIGIGSSYFSCGYAENATGTDLQTWFGLGFVTVASAGITYTGDQYGFKEVRAASASTWSATNANGTTETATSVGTNFDKKIMNAQKNSTTNIKFYRDQTLLATHTTNLPNSNYADPGAAISNANVATASTRLVPFFNASINAQ